MMLNALPLAHFWRVLLSKEQMMTSVRKTLKTLVSSAQNRSISSEIFPENNHKIRRFFTNCFSATFAQKIPAESADFSAILSLQIPRNLTFFSATYQKPCLDNMYMYVSQALYQMFQTTNINFEKLLG